MSTIAFVLRRARHYWQVLATVALGVILAVGLLASGPTLVDTALEFGLRRVLLTAEPVDAHLRVVTRDEPEFLRFQVLTRETKNLLTERFGDQILAVIPAGQSRWFFPVVDGVTLADERVNFRFYDNDTAALAGHTTFSAGGWPEHDQPADNVIAGVIGDAMADAYELEVGDRLPLALRSNSGETDFTLEVSGILLPDNSRELYWFGPLNPLLSQGDNRFAEQWGALLPAEQFFTISKANFAPSEVELTWQILLDHDNLTLPEVGRLQVNARDLSERIKSVKSDMILQSNLAETLQRYSQQADAIRTPLYFLLSTVVLLGLYYVVMAAILTLEQRQREISVIRSRGASRQQLLGWQLAEATLIAFVALLVGPLLAYIFVALLATLGPLADVREATWALRLPSAAWLAGAVGALAAIATLMLPVPAALQRSIVNYQQEQARRTKPPFWQRFYLDVILLVVGLILLGRLQLFGSLIGGDVSTPRVDWLLLISPLALLLGAATILLRVFPQLLHGLTALVSRLAGFPALLAFLQPSRNPNHITRLVLLLTLAMALGLFSTGLNATLDRNEVDSANYAVGADLRVINPGLGNLEAAAETEGVGNVAWAFRSTGRLEQRIRNSFPEFDALMIEPESFLAVTSFRPDFASEPLPEMVAALGQFELEELPTQPLPGEPESFGLWLWIAEEDLANLNFIDFDAKFVTAQEIQFNIHLNIPEFDPNPSGNWHYFTGQIPELGHQQLPLALHSLWIRSRTPFFAPEEPLAIDDLTVMDRRSGVTQIINSFETPADQLLSSASGLTTALVQNEPSQSGTGRLQFDFNNRGLRSWRWHGLNFAGPIPDTPVPALVDSKFQRLTNVALGDEIGIHVNAVRINLKIIGVVDYFPTLYDEQEAGYIITLAKPLLNRINLISPQETVLNELYIDDANARVTAETVAAENPGLIRGRSQVLEAEAIRKGIKTDPLALGLRSITLFGYILTSVLSLAGFGAHFYMSARQRASSYGVLRAIGLSPRQLYASLMLEQSALVLAGLALGTILGLLLNWLVLTQLPISLGGRPPAPPFIAETDWGAVAQIYLTLAVAFFLSLLLAVYWLWRMQLHRVLRVGEE